MGAVTGAVVADCFYGSGKSSVPVIKSSKKNKRKRKKYLGTRDNLHLESSIPFLISHNCHPERVADDCWTVAVFGCLVVGGGKEEE